MVRAAPNPLRFLAGRYCSPRIDPGASSGSRRSASCFIGRSDRVGRLTQPSAGRDLEVGACVTGLAGQAYPGGVEKHPAGQPLQGLSTMPRPAPVFQKQVSQVVWLGCGGGIDAQCPTHGSSSKRGTRQQSCGALFANWRPQPPAPSASPSSSSCAVRRVGRLDRYACSPGSQRWPDAGHGRQSGDALV